MSKAKPKEVVSNPLILLQLSNFGCGCGSPPRRPLVSWTASSSCLASLEIRQFRNETGFRDDLKILKLLDLRFYHEPLNRFL